ncbi:5'-methylthioadenosine/S-adenosylhomocysteine nucleosidase family protein [Streptomyces sp. HUAS TT20]|uniref:5'-methylthioadenosine/S-adenosylhomocysteine nucleosidase family protein n=1 Tax=Streptomyces sp. HUAS TT20 TaxID=3447509 RepID=UPI0021D892DB|nr:5'-methylthioadenosine/S-adenosylhomocysteine nucleosidase [Streptomyces sp. HUAS 15-9]UXY30019.1 5'-methylthioadenosine/S-adenosylhomocysteine nucleosidase [Streptomyces sp. HUAS 15-9]
MPETQSTVLVLTALALEYSAVRAHVEDRQDLVHPGNGTWLERGRLPGTPWHVAIGELGEGARATAALTASLIDWLRPRAVLFVGVAGSLKDDIGIGDVVVGTKVYGIHGGKQTAEGLLIRPEAWYGSNALVQAARSAVRDMADVRTHFKPIATGDVVLADAGSEIARQVREHYNDAAAIEMEGAGAAHAAHLSGQVDALVVRGISDRADALKSEADAGGSQERAAAQAASVAMAVLRKHRPGGGDVSARSEEEPRAVHGGDHIDFRGGTFYGPVIGKRVDRR